MTHVRNLNAVSIGACPGNLKTIQIQRHAFRVDLDAVGFGDDEVGREIVGAGLIDNELVVRIARIDAGRRGRGLEVGARLHFIELFHRRPGRPGRVEAALSEGGDGEQQRPGGGGEQVEEAKRFHDCVRPFQTDLWDAAAENRAFFARLGIRGRGC